MPTHAISTGDVLSLAHGACRYALVFDLAGYDIPKLFEKPMGWDEKSMMADRFKKTERPVQLDDDTGCEWGGRQAKSRRDHPPVVGCVAMEFARPRNSKSRQAISPFCAVNSLFVHRH